MWSNLIKFNQVWSNLIQFEQVWSSLNNFEQDWTRLNKFDQVWTSLNKFEQDWTRLNKFEQDYLNLTSFCKIKQFQSNSNKKVPKRNDNFLIKDLYFYFELIHEFPSTEMVFDKCISDLFVSAQNIIYSPNCICAYIPLVSGFLKNLTATMINIFFG